MKATGTNRRDFFANFLKPLRTDDSCHETADAPRVTGDQTADAPTVAIVQGRFCLAYQNSFCSTCVERCPVPGAITVEQGMPRIDPTICTGCKICHDVCPAPRNAILLAPRNRVKRAAHS